MLGAEALRGGCERAEATDEAAKAGRCIYKQGTPGPGKNLRTQAGRLQHRNHSLFILSFPFSDAMLRPPLSLLALGLLASSSSSLAATAGSFADGGSTLVSAMMVCSFPSTPLLLSSLPDVCRQRGKNIHIGQSRGKCCANSWSSRVGLSLVGLPTCLSNGN